MSCHVKNRWSVLRGFTLISVFLGLTVSLLVTTHSLSFLPTFSQWSARWWSSQQLESSASHLTHLFQREFRAIGFYQPSDLFSAKYRNPQLEARYMEQFAIVHNSPFEQFPAVTSTGYDDSQGSDSLAVITQTTRDCRGYQLGYQGEEFLAVNHYFVEDHQLRCRGYDLYVLLGLKEAEGHNAHRSVSLQRGVLMMRVVFLVSRNDQPNHRQLSTPELFIAPSVQTGVEKIGVDLILDSGERSMMQRPFLITTLSGDAITLTTNHLYHHQSFWYPIPNLASRLQVSAHNDAGVLAELTAHVW